MKNELRATCPFCSLHCADLRLTIEEGRLTRLSPRCELARRNYARVFQSIAERSENPIQTDEFTHALTLLGSARRLLVVLSADASNEAVNGSLRMVRKFNGVLTVENEELYYLNAGMKDVGCFTATLGELKEVETVFMCATEPGQTHPRLSEFLSKDATEHSIVINPRDSFETMRRLRLALAGEKQETPGKYKKIIDTMRSASTGVAFFDSTFLQTGEPTAREFLLWLRDLNRFGRWYAQYLPGSTNSVGVTDTLLSFTGIAGGLSASEDIEEASPRHWRTVKLIEEKWMDTCLLVGNPHTLGENMATALQGVKTILIDPMPPSWKSAVWLPAAQAGVNAAGSMARLDGVPVLLEQLTDSGRLPIRTMLDMLIEGRVPS